MVLNPWDEYAIEEGIRLKENHGATDVIALSMGDEDVPVVNLDRCFGCAVCATGCPDEAIKMVNKPGYPEIPRDAKALKEAARADGA